MQNLIQTLRKLIDIEEVFFILGAALIYIGVAAQFGHPIAMIALGALLTGTAFYLANQ